jgi:hypothetical protein
MMEIPAGKACWQVDMSQAINGHGTPVVCLFLHDNHPDEDSFDIDCIAFDHHFDKRCLFPPPRCPACLSAYPNGAVITITPKGVK